MLQAEGISFPLSGVDATLTAGLDFIIVFLAVVGSAYFLLRFFWAESSSRSWRNLAWFFLTLGAAATFVMWIIGDFFVTSPDQRNTALMYSYLFFCAGAFGFVAINEQVEHSRRRPFSIALGLLVLYMLITLILQARDVFIQIVVGIPVAILYIIQYIRKVAKVLNYNRAMFKSVFGSFLGLFTIVIGMIFMSDSWLPLLGLAARIISEIFLICGFNVFLATFERIPGTDEYDWMTKIRALLVIYNNGVHIFSRFWKEGRIVEGADLMAGALVAVKAVLEEMVGEEKTKTVTLEDQTILFEYRERFSCVIIADEKLKSLQIRLKQFADEFAGLFAPVLKDWQGIMEAFVPAEAIADAIFLPRFGNQSLP